MAKKPRRPLEETPIPQEVEDNIARSIGEEPPSQKKVKTPPVYKVVGESKVPVAKAAGAVWKSRKEASLKKQKQVSGAWDEAVRYFMNDQTSHRTEGVVNRSGNNTGAKKLNRSITETENIVYANVSTMIPMLYSKNPSAEFTIDEPAMKPIATMLERLVNNLGSKTDAPGINLKPKAKRCVVWTLLANRSWIEVNWVFKENSSEQAMADLATLSQELEKAKEPKDIEEIEGKITALDHKIGMLEPSGPKIRVKSPHEVLFDLNCGEIDLSDAAWAMCCEYLPTNFINAMYAEKDKESNEYKSIYKPTHVIKAGKTNTDTGSLGEEDYDIFKSDDGPTKYGYDDEEAFEKARMTKVWKVWDKTTRRLLMYAENDWTWPIWVWDDPYKLQSFFNVFPLVFMEGPAGPQTKGEVTYYLDQQDAINDIVTAEHMAREWAKRNVFFDKNRTTQADVDAVLKGDDGTARGIDIPEGGKGSDVIFSIAPPFTQFKELFNKEEKYAAIERISAASSVFSGKQFKTNTTNKAVETNVSAANTRADEKADQIEDFIGRVYWAVAQLCLQHMQQDQVVELIGPTAAQGWRNMDAPEIRQTLGSMKVAGGSTKKPTSQAKKEEAIEVGQVLGQFVNAAPGPVLKIMLKVFEQAFDEITIKEEDWKAIDSAIQQQQAPAPGATGTPAPEEEGSELPEIDPANLDEILAQMPEELKKEVALNIKAGTDPKTAVQQGLKKAMQIQQQQAAAQQQQPTIQ